MLTLEELIENSNQQSKIWLERMSFTSESVKKFSSNFNYHHVLLALSNLIKSELYVLKHNFYVSGLIDELQIKKFNSRLLDYGLKSIAYCILSDNESLIQRYAKLRYQRDVNTELSMDEMVLKGESAITCNTVQFFLENNSEGIERNLNIYELKKDKILKRGKELELDFTFFKALHTNDKSKMEEILGKLVSAKIHKKRNDNPILNQYISLPALGYAKLAWRKGIEVEVNSPLVPKELLPIKPLDNYEIPYDFLKDSL